MDVIMFFKMSKKQDSILYGKTRIAYHNPNQPHSPDLQIVLLKNHGEYVQDDCICDIGVEFPEDIPSVYCGLFSADLDKFKNVSCILVATSSGQIDYSDNRVWINLRAGQTIHNQEIKAAPEYDLNSSRYIPSATHIVGALIKRDVGWRYSELDLYRPERLQNFMTRLSSSRMTLHRFQKLIKLKQGVASPSYATELMQSLVTLPWMSPAEVTQFMSDVYNPQIIQLHGDIVMQDCQIAWDPLLRYPQYREAAKTMLQDGAKWWPKSLSGANGDKKFDHLLSAKPISPNWVKLVLGITPEDELMRYCATPDNADAVYASLKYRELIPLLSPKMKRDVLADDLNL